MFVYIDTLQGGLMFWKSGESWIEAKGLRGLCIRYFQTISYNARWLAGKQMEIRWRVKLFTFP
jgi:hypothetical protein